MIRDYGPAKCHSMAGDVGNRDGGLDDRLTKEAQSKLGLLALSFEQSLMDRLGAA
jgi:hypothetical protein